MRQESRLPPIQGVKGKVPPRRHPSGSDATTHDMQHNRLSRRVNNRARPVEWSLRRVRGAEFGRVSSLSSMDATPGGFQKSVLFLDNSRDLMFLSAMWFMKRWSVER